MPGIVPGALCKILLIIVMVTQKLASIISISANKRTETKISLSISPTVRKS